LVYDCFTMGYRPDVGIKTDGKQESSMVNVNTLVELSEQEIDLVAGGEPNEESNTGVRGNKGN